MHKILLRFAVYHPKLVLVTALLLSAAALCFIPRIRLRLDGRSLIPAGEQTLAASDAASASFKLNDIVVLCFVSREGGIRTAEGLERIGKVSEELQRTEGILDHSVTSITTMPLLAARNGIIDPHAPLRDTVIDSVTLERTRHETEMLGLDNGIILSGTDSAAAVYAFVRPDADREKLLERVNDIASRNRGSGMDIYIGGTALAQAELGRSVALDLSLLVPCLIALLVLLMTTVFRNLNVALVSLAEIGLSLVWTVGLIGLLDQPVFITTLALPVVLIAIGVTDDIYGINRYIGARRKLSDKTNEEVVIAAFEHVSKPIMLTAFTSMSGLASLAIASLEPLRVFGIFGAIAIGLSSLCTFTLVPALLALRPPKLREGSVKVNRGLAKIASRLLHLVETVGPRRVVLGVLVLAVGGVYVSSHLRIDDSWINNLSPSSHVAEGDRYINRYLAGSTTVDFALNTGNPDGFLDPGQFKVLARMEEALAGVARVGAVQSTYSDVLRINATLRGLSYREFRRAVLSDSIELTRADIEAALLIDETLDRPRLGNYLVNDNRDARLTVFVHGADYEHLRPVLAAAAGVILDPASAGTSESPFGDGWISYVTVKLLVEGQIYSIALAALSDLLLVALVLRSFRTALVAVVPVMIGVLFTFTTLVLFGLPLGIASSMFASIALGIGVDYSIHLAVETRDECRKSPSLRIALRRTFATTAPSIIVSAATITTGFAVLLLSSVVPNRVLGLLVCISLTICAAMTLIVVPGLAEIFQVWKSVKREGKRVVVAPPEAEPEPVSA